MERQIKIAGILAHILDDQFTFFGKRIGFAAVIGLLPEIGDTVELFLSLYIVIVAIRCRVPGMRILQMIVNIGISFLVGLIPFLGDLIYVYRQVNLMNFAILKEHATKTSSSYISTKG